MNEPMMSLAGVDGPPVEREIAFDMIRRALPFVPVLLLVSSLIWGINGGLSAGYAVVLVLANFAFSAALLGWAAKTSLALLMGVALFGYLFRLGLITAAVLVVHNQSWVSIVPLGLSIIVTHLGLLLWETRYVSLSLAFPALPPKDRVKPKRKD
jgi:hypothetical protein